MYMTTSFETKLKRVSIQSQFKGNAKPTKTSWKLLQNAENMTFDELMPLLGKTRKPVDKACICMSAAIKATTVEQIAKLAIEISKSEQSNKIVNVIDTVYPDSKAVQLVASEATQHFLARLNVRAGRKAMEGAIHELSEEESLALEICSIR
jgi:hypothetical protein